MSALHRDRLHLGHPSACGDEVDAWMTRLTPAQRERISAHLGRPAPDEEECKRREDAEALRQQEATRQTYRVAGYLHRRPAEYTDSSLARLLLQQNPKNKIKGWLDSGAKTLLLLGPSGHGKTDAAYAICNEALSRGIWVNSWYAPDLHNSLRPLEAHERHDAVLSASRSRALREVRDSALFYFDDLGREDSGGWGVERWRSTVTEIFTHRVNTPGLRNIVSANVTSKKTAITELTERYGAPLITRLSQDCVPAWIEGELLRTFALWEPDF